MAVTRSLSSPSQVLKREARRAQRAGFRGVAEKLYGEGVATSLEEKEARGSNIRSYEEEVARDRTQQRAADLSNAQRAALLRGETPASAPESTQSPARSTNASLNEARPGETATQFYARQRESRMGTPKPAAPAATASQTTQQPAPAPKPAAPIDYLDTSGSPMVEQTRAEKDMVRREALQSAYDRLTNPTGAAGSMAEVSAQQAKASAAPAAPTTPAGPTMSELVSGLRESFDRRNAINSEASRKADMGRTEKEISDPRSEMGLDDVKIARVEEEIARIKEEIARNEGGIARSNAEIARSNAETARLESEISPGAARFTGRLIRDAATEVGSAAIRGPQVASEAVKSTASGMLEANRRLLRGAKKTASESAAGFLRSRREFIEGLQGQ
jgi:hypothetical protein